MPFTIVVVTPLITIMQDQVEYLNKIGVAAARWEEIWMKPLKVEAVKLFTEVPNRGCLMNGQKGLQKGKLGKQVAAIAIDEVHSITE